MKTIQINGITFRDGEDPKGPFTGDQILRWACPELTQEEAVRLAAIGQERILRNVLWLRNHITGNLPALREKMKREAEEMALPPKPPAYEVVATTESRCDGIMTVEDGVCNACGHNGPVVWAATADGEYGSVTACAGCIGKAFARWAERKAEE